MSIESIASEWQQEEDAADFRNLKKARVMMALGDTDPVWPEIVKGFEQRVELEARLMVGGS